MRWTTVSLRAGTSADVWYFSLKVQDLLVFFSVYFLFPEEYLM